MYHMLKRVAALTQARASSGFGALGVLYLT